jgi:TRAP-type transport system periplasmic protein
MPPRPRMLTQVAAHAPRNYRRTTVNCPATAATRSAASMLVVFVLLAGCGSAGTDKIGAAHRKPLVLTMAHGNDADQTLQVFADEVARRSGGTLRIQVINDWRDGQRDYEAGIIRDVKAGKADLGVVGSRAWDAVGVTSLDALQAPFLIDSYALEQDVLQSGIPAKMLQGLAPLGLVGLGVLPGPLRYPLSAPRPLRTPADFAGLRVGYQGADEPAESLRALGAKPVQLPTGAGWDGIDAIEQQLASIDGNSYEAFAKYLTANVTLWPRPNTIFINNKTFTSLTTSQRTLLHQAASDAIPAALAVVRTQERTALTRLCRARIDLVTATPTDLAELHAAVAPVLARIERNPQTRSFITTIDATRSTAGTTAETAPSCAANRSQAPLSAPIPNGTYEGFSTSRDAQRAGVPPNDARRTLILGPNTVLLKEAYPDGHTDIGWNGTYSVYRDRIILTNASDGYTVTARWSYDGVRLRFTDVGPKATDALVWGSHPWLNTR